MAENPSSPSLPGAPGGLLLATKLHVPRPPSASVPRPRLVSRLAAGRQVVLVCAPAGSGKTSLVADWARSGGRPVAWLSLDAGDDDPVRFWRHVAAAVDRVRPGVAETVGARLAGGRPAALEAAVTVLVNELATRPAEVALVVDDYHLVRSPVVHRSVEFLLEHLPPSLRLVIAGRADPPLPLALLRARGQLVELRSADLRFTSEETARLLRTAVGSDLPDAVVTALEERTEGWVAGLRLAALSLQGRTDVGGFVEEFTGSHRYVLDYLTEEVLDRQPEHLRTFLLESSVLDRVSGPLCDAVRDRDDSQALLEEAERAGLFLQPLDGARRWWRYHHLFADLLRTRLAHQCPGRVPELHRAAAAWYERHGSPDDAIGHALAAGEPDRAARLIERHLDDQILRRNEGATLARWLTALPPEVLRRRPRLRLGQAVAALLGGRLDQVEPHLAAAERALVDAADEPYEPSIGRTASILANTVAVAAVCRADLARLHGDPALESAHARQALAAAGDDDRLLASIARYHVAVADWLDGRLADAERALVDVVAERLASGERHMTVRAAYDLGTVQQAQGRLGAALHTYRRALDLSSSPPPLASAGMAHVGLAEALYARDELDAAEEHLSAGVPECRQLAYAPPLVTGLLTLARVRQACGDRAGALAALDEAADVVPQVVDLRNPVPALRAQLAIAAGEVSEAARWVRSRGLGVEDEPAYPREREYLVLARLLLAQRTPERAAAMLDRWHALAVAQERTAGVLEIRVLQALAEQARGDDGAALAALAEALAAGAAEGHVRVFVDEGAPVAVLLRELVIGRRLEQLTGADTVPRAFLARLTAAFDRRGTPVVAPARHGAVAAPGLVEPLSAREREVLAHLATGQLNREIAEDLVITLDTVKRHVSHVFAKLSVTNRTQAVVRARELGLLR
jgi:LuxR family transcriptional regulator, maltose regulon positive regulatory protein